jgi:hypothetical protein
MDISNSHGLQKGGGLRRSASVCDVRPVEGSPNAFYATVKKTGKVSVPKREKREDRDLYIQNRQSAYYSSTGQPIRPPRRKKRSEYEESSHYGTPQRVRRMEEGSVNGNGTPQMDNHYSQSPSKTRATEKHYSSKQLKYGSEKENHYDSRENHYGVPIKRENHYGVPREKENNYGIPREKENHYGVPIKVEKRVENHYVDNPKRSQVRENHSGSQQRSRITQTETLTAPRTNVTEKYYFGNPTTTSKTTRNSHSSNHIQSATMGHKTHNQETPSSTAYYRDEPQSTYRSISRLHRSNKDMYHSTGDIYATPHKMDHRIIYTADSPNMSPNTKYKTKIVLNAS